MNKNIAPNIIYAPVDSISTADNINYDILVGGINLKLNINLIQSNLPKVGFIYKFTYVDYTKEILRISIWTTNIVILANDGSGVKLLCIKDNIKDIWSVPGGFIGKDEDPLDSCIRTLYEQTNLQLDKNDLLYVNTYNKHNRDYRYKFSESISYTIYLNHLPQLVSNNNSLDLCWLDVKNYSYGDITCEYAYSSSAKKINANHICILTYENKIEDHFMNDHYTMINDAYESLGRPRYQILNNKLGILIFINKPNNIITVRLCNNPINNIDFNNFIVKYTLNNLNIRNFLLLQISEILNIKKYNISEYNIYKDNHYTLKSLLIDESIQEDINFLLEALDESGFEYYSQKGYIYLSKITTYDEIYDFNWDLFKIN